MGNENSQINGIEIEDKAIEISEFWYLYKATIKDSCRYFSLSSDDSIIVFKGENVKGPLWTISSPLEKFTNNLLKYRHPYIIRYLSAWQQRSTLHLATEFAQPLANVLTLQSPLQKCIGLNNILQALTFLHEQANMSHNNICVSSIYVTIDGQWKLGGLQYLCPFNEITPAFLKHSRIHRYDKGIDPDEDSYSTFTKIDQFAFAVLVEDVFKGCSDSEVPYLKEFKSYCHEYLQNKNIEKRPNLSTLMQHSFFNHEFISIYKFLSYLPLKSEDEKSSFFLSILQNMKLYDEETVAKQFGGLLLSRIAMLDTTARQSVIPSILKPRNDRNSDEEDNGFFSLGVYKEHIKPRLLQLFSVRDIQVRMLLLNLFTDFVQVFTHDELSQHILPELLIGIKDVDDELVSATLVCLSELVPILGADTVIGGKRSKLFSDGRPDNKTYTQAKNVKKTCKTLQELSCSEEVLYEDFDKRISMRERLSPDGGEVIAEENNIINISNDKHIESGEDWSDWEHNDKLSGPPNVPSSFDLISTGVSESNSHSVTDVCHTDTKPNLNISPLSKKELMQTAAIEAKKNITDISLLDIKSQKVSNSSKHEDEFDFFADMTPVIEKATIASVSPNTRDDFIKLQYEPTDDGDDSKAWDEWNE